MNESRIVVASYERVSTRNQGRYGYSLGAQHQSLEDFARTQGWLLPEHLRFRDGENEDASGVDWDLPDLNRMLEAARRREFECLIVPDFDRFARSLVKGLVLEEQLKKYGVRVVYQRVPVEDTPEGRLLKNQLFSFAEYEREKFALRSLMGRRQKARIGHVVGGGEPPYGYRFTRETLDNGAQRVCGLEPDPHTAPIARRILAALRARSTIEIAVDLNRDGIPAPRGGMWKPRAIYYVAIDPVYAGTWVFGKRKQRVSPDAHNGIAVQVPALISRQEWDDVQQALARRRYVRRGRFEREEDPFLLRGLLTCGHCHGGLHSRVNTGIRYYHCWCALPSAARAHGKAPCDLPDLHALNLEAELWRILSATLLDPNHLEAGLDAARAQHDEADQLRRERLATIDAEIGRQRQRLDTIAMRLVDAGQGEIYAALMRQAKDIEELVERLGRERGELAAVRNEGLSLEEASAIRSFADDVRDGLAVATPFERRQVFELLQVRGRAYVDPDGVRIGRKHRFRIEWEAAIELRHNNRLAPYQRFA